jgi:hypothetical protein
MRGISRMARVGWALVLLCLTALACASTVSAAAPGAGWSVQSVAQPTNFTKQQNGHPVVNSYNILATNTGNSDTSGPITVTDNLPPGFRATGASGGEAANDSVFSLIAKPFSSCEVSSSGDSVSCVFLDSVPPGGILDMYVGVSLESSAGEQERNVATVAGGGAPSASTSDLTRVSSTPAPFGVENFGLHATGLDGETGTQAGDRPYEANTFVYFNTRFHDSSEAAAHKNEYMPSESVKDLVFDLPRGLIGNPQVIGKCPLWRVTASVESGEQCPASTQIGVVHIYIGLKAGQDAGTTLRSDTEPIYNVMPEENVPAQFAFSVSGALPINLRAAVSEETDYGVRILVGGIPHAGYLAGTSTTFFGSPLTDPNTFNHSVGANPVAFLTNPVDCSAGPLTATVSADSWEHPGAWLANGEPNLADSNWQRVTSTSYPSLEGCDLLQFQPTVSVQPDTTQADEPAGTTVDVHVPQSTDQFPALQTPELRDASVTLPAGMTLSASAADGLQACSDEQLAVQSIEPATCPDGSVQGTVRIFTPLLERPLEGQIFLGSPECDPCTSADAADGKELRLYIQAAGSGVRIKREGRIYANPSTGQLTTKFEGNPQLPFEDLQLHFNSGPRAGLATPQTCGTATTTADFTPWSTPITPDAAPSSSFGVNWDGAGGACPGSLPFAPSFSAGTSNPNAGQYSPLTLTFGREDREQDLSQIQVHMPPGLLGTLSNVLLCGEPQASLGTCSGESRIGSLTVSAGPGTHPFYQHGTIYLTGPYGGAPFGLSIVVPTVAGPFNLGNVVVRARISVDPVTTALTVTSDPFPQIIDGIPLRLRSTNVTIDRPGFIFNPTDCAQLHIAATISGAQGAQAQVSAPFAVAGCAGLHFGPTFKASTTAHTSRVNGASLDVKLDFPTGPQSNISHVKVELPKALPSRLTTLQKACPAAKFDANPASCPADSVVGVAKATTPVLPVPLIGPAYFVSNGGEAFPNLIVVLQGYGVRINLVGDTFISKQGITSSTFTNVPDVQVNSFELYLPTGPDSALAANGNLCKQKLRMPSLFTAQDGAQLKQITKIQVAGCPKTTTNTRKTRKARKASHRHSGHGRSK